MFFLNMSYKPSRVKFYVFLRQNDSFIFLKKEALRNENYFKFFIDKYLLIYELICI